MTGSMTDPSVDPTTIRVRGDRWLRWYRATGEVTLACLPHACGSATFYRSWTRRLPPRFAVCAVQYPGHEDRFGEPCMEDLGEVAGAIAATLSAIDGPVLLFGHSLGAAVAYEVAQRLRERVVGLAVSGRPAPHVAGAPPRFDTDEELWDELTRLGGTGDQLLGNPRVRGLLTPMLRSDFRMNSGYRYTPAARLTCPVRAYRGADDDTATADQVRRWGDLTSGSFAQHEYPGGHFYLGTDPDPMLTDLAVTW